MVWKSITVRSLVARFSQNSALKLSLYQFHDTSTIFTLSFFFFPSYLETRNHSQQQLINLGLLGNDDQVCVGALVDLLDRVVQDSLHVDLPQRLDDRTILRTNKPKNAQASFLMVFVLEVGVFLTGMSRSFGRSHSLTIPAPDPLTTIVSFM